MFRLFPSHYQGACYMVQRKNSLYIFQDKVIYLSVKNNVYIFQDTVIYTYVSKRK